MKESETQNERLFHWRPLSFSPHVVCRPINAADKCRRCPLKVSPRDRHFKILELVV